jgi:hypothetical protein
LSGRTIQIHKRCLPPANSVLKTYTILTFRIYFFRIKQSKTLLIWKLDRYIVPNLRIGTTNLRRVYSQKRDYLIDIAAEAWKHSMNFFSLPRWWRILQTNRTAVILSGIKWCTINILFWLPESKMNRRCISSKEKHISYFTFFRLYVIYRSVWSHIMAN